MEPGSSLMVLEGCRWSQQHITVPVIAKNTLSSSKHGQTFDRSERFLKDATP